MQLVTALATLSALNSVALGHGNDWADSSMVARVEKYVRRILGPDYMVRRAGGHGSIKMGGLCHGSKYSGQYHHDHCGLRAVGLKHGYHHHHHHHHRHHHHKRHYKGCRKYQHGHHHHHKIHKIHKIYKTHKIHKIEHKLHKAGLTHGHYHHHRHLGHHHRHRHSHSLGHKIRKFGRKIKRNVKRTLRAVGIGRRKHHARRYGAGYHHHHGIKRGHYSVSHGHGGRHYYKHKGVGHKMRKVRKRVKKILRGGHKHHRKGYGDFVRVYRFPLNSHVSGEIVIE